MPVIARFYGIIIKMYFNHHLPPHFHAFYGKYNGLYDLNTLEMLYDLKPKLSDERFSILRDRGLFKAVQVDGGGFGIS
jgi:hypothetical protein